MSKKLNYYPCLLCSLEIVPSIISGTIGKKKVIASTPTLKVIYENSGNQPSYSSYLCTYIDQQDPVTSGWKHHIYKKEIIPIQPGGQGSFDYKFPQFVGNSNPVNTHLPHPAHTSHNPIPTSTEPSINFRIIVLLFDPLLDPLPNPIDSYFSTNVVDRHVAYSKMF